jgi:large subunit ribosomal protein L25
MSDQLTLRAETGRTAGSRTSRRIRRAGGVPGVVYGRGMDPLMVTVDHHDLSTLLTKGGSNAIITLDVEGEEHVTMPKAIDRHPYRPLIRHVDFLKISLTEKTTADVVVHVEGEPAGARDGGVLQQLASTVAIEALPAAIPQWIVVDVSELGVGDSIRISDLTPPEGAEFLDDPETALVSVSIPRAVVEEEEPVEGEEVEGEQVAAPSDFDTGGGGETSE